METKTTCTKTIIVKKKELANKLGINGKVDDIKIHREYSIMGDWGHDDGIEITVNVSEEKTND